MARGDGIHRTSARNMRLTTPKLKNAQQHNEREKESYINQDIVPERSHLNVHFKKPDSGYLEQFEQMETNGLISTRGIKEDAFRYGTLVCCASSYDGDVFPPMHYFLHKLSIKGYQRRRIALLENGTWAPSAARAMKEIIGKMKDIELIDPVVTIRSRMKQEDMPSFDRLVKALIAE